MSNPNVTWGDHNGPHNLDPYYISAEDERRLEYREREDVALDERLPCPECGTYYSLSSAAPPLPSWLAEYGTDEEIGRWENEHNYNVVSCSVCGWREDVE